MSRIIYKFLLPIFFIPLFLYGLALSQEEVELLTFEQEFVESAIKLKQRVEEAPSSVFIIRSDQISMFSFFSIGDILNWTPGLWGIYNYTTYNFGVRGIHGGPKAGSRIFKVMIDSSDYLAFRPSGESLLGPEFIPISMIKSVEIVKGPASALYGANAFMGTINVKTKEPDEMDPLFIRAMPGILFGEKKVNFVQLGELSSSLISNFGELEVPLAFGVYLTQWKRDGLGFSTSSLGFSESDIVTNIKERNKNRNLYFDKLSQNDDLSSASLLLITGARLKDFNLKVKGLFQGFSASAQFLDYGILNPANRVSLLNSGLSAELSYQIEQAGFVVKPTIYMGFFFASPITQRFPSENITLFEPDRKVVETGTFVGTFGSSAVDGRAEISVQKEKNLVLLGADIMNDSENILKVFQQLPGGLTPVSVPEKPKITFRNTGFYGQAYVFPFEKVTEWKGFSVLGLGGLFGVRYDDHNIYEDVLNLRIGVVTLPLKKRGFLTYLKGIYGTSFRAPSPEQLFAKPQFAGDFDGNPDLKPEKARIFETIFGGDFGLTDFSVKPEISIFFIAVRDAIKFEKRGAFIRAVNIQRQQSVGTDVTLVLKYLKLVEFSLGYSFSRVTVFDKEGGVDVEYHDEFFPPHIINSSLVFRKENIGAFSSFSVGVLGRFVSRRSAPTTAMKEFTGFAYNPQKYYLPSYFNLGLAIRVETTKIFGYYTAGTIRFESIPSLFGFRYWEPGFSGLDIPGTPPVIFLSVEQAF